MPTPVQGYFNAAGQRIPGTTTVISRFKESGGLIHWAWQLGKDGKDYRVERDTAANAGTMAHAMVEQWIKGEAPMVEGPEDVVKKARGAFEAFLEWAEQTKLKVTHTEIRLVSEKHQFGGTLDAMLVNGKLALGDWKTANAVYADNMIQLAAYHALWEENFPDQPITGGHHLLRFAKEHGDFAHYYWPDLSEAWTAFKHMRALYDLDKSLRKRIGK